uniref:Uncharacterized protein n=1 Tax=Timema monikensis TaxID=170555 RepID=A0A7R9DZW0_9NEOP|nr:unnamed protein product [Timema monikensis]
MTPECNHCLSKATESPNSAITHESCCLHERAVMILIWFAFKVLSSSLDFTVEIRPHVFCQGAAKYYSPPISFNTAVSLAYTNLNSHCQHRSGFKLKLVRGTDLQTRGVLSADKNTSAQIYSIKHVCLNIFYTLVFAAHLTTHPDYAYLNHANRLARNRVFSSFFTTIELTILTSERTLDTEG